MSKIIGFITLFKVTFLLMIPIFLTAQKHGRTTGHVACLLPEGVELYAKGTGRTTGHIADFYFINNSGQGIEMSFPPVTIPSTVSYQGYIIPDDILINIPTGTTQIIPVKGYCTDYQLPVMDSGTDLPECNTWSTEVPLIDLLKRLENSISGFQETGDMVTPLSDFPEKEKEFIIQQVVWLNTMPEGTFDPCTSINNYLQNNASDSDLNTIGNLPVDLMTAQFMDALIQTCRDLELPEFIPPSIPEELAIPVPADNGGEVGTLLVKVKGTGRTTNHIITLYIENPGKKQVTLRIGENNGYYIPSSGDHQPYIVPEIPDIIVPGRQTVEVPLYGYCVDIRRPPVGLGEPIPDISEWVESPGSGKTTGMKPDQKNYVKIPVQQSHPIPVISEMLQNPPYDRGGLPWDCPDILTGNIPTIPGTDIPVRIPVDFNNAPGVATTLLVEAIRHISTAFDNLKERGGITTPFSSHPDREREAVIQQTFWMYTSALEGKAYDKADFHQNTVKQFEGTTNKKYDDLPQEQKDQLDVGVDDFWNSFSAVGAEAKILPSVPAAPKIELPVLQDVFNPQNFKKYAAELPSDYTLPDDIMISDEKKKDKPQKENKQCECGMVSVKITIWDFDEKTNKSKEGTGKSETRNATTSNTNLDDYEINLGKDKIPAGQSQIFMIYVEKIECPCVNLAAEGVKIAQEALQEAGKMKVGQNNTEKDLTKLEEDLKKLNDKKRKNNSDEKKISELEAKIAAIKAAQKAISKAKEAAKTSDCTIFFDQSDVRKKAEERKKNPNIEVRSIDGKNTTRGEWKKDSGDHEGYVFTIKKVGNTPMEFRFSLSFHCQDDDCKPVACMRNFVVKVEK